MYSHMYTYIDIDIKLIQVQIYPTGSVSLIEPSHKDFGTRIGSIGTEY